MKTYDYVAHLRRGIDWWDTRFNPKKRTASLRFFDFYLWNDRFVRRNCRAFSATVRVSANNFGVRANTKYSMPITSLRDCADCTIRSRFLPRCRNAGSGVQRRILWAGTGDDTSAAARPNLNRCFLVILTVTAVSILAALPVRAETVLPPGTEQFLPKNDSALTSEKAGSWQFADLLMWLGKAALVGSSEPIRFTMQSLLYLMMACMVGLLCNNSGWKKCLDSVSVLGFGAISLSSMMTLITHIAQTAQESQTYLAAFVPVFSGVLLLGGQSGGAAGYSGLFFSMSTFLSILIEKLLLPVMRIYFCFAVSASLWDNRGIEEAANLFEKCLNWLLKCCSMLFCYILGLQNILSGLADSAALRIGGSVLVGAIPIVGDAAAAALSSAAGAMHLLKGTLALGLIVSMATAFSPVFLRCTLYYLAFSGAGIVAAGSGQTQCGRICRLFAWGAKLCSSILTLYFFMIFLSTALLLIIGNGG